VRDVSTRAAQTNPGWRLGPVDLGAGQRLENSSYEGGAVSNRGNRNLDCTVPVKLIESVLHPRDREPLPAR